MAPRKKHSDSVIDLARHYRRQGLSRAQVKQALARAGHRVSDGWLSGQFKKERRQTSRARQLELLAKLSAACENGTDADVDAALQALPLEPWADEFLAKAIEIATELESEKQP